MIGRGILACALLVPVADAGPPDGGTITLEARALPAAALGRRVLDRHDAAVSGLVQMTVATASAGFENELPLIIRGVALEGVSLGD